MNHEIDVVLEELYETFKGYEIGNLADVSCFDLGPTEAEVAGLKEDLRNITDKTLSGMEFFGTGWTTWGTKAEVGYFLPRLMEYLAADIKRLEHPGLFSLFDCKLTDLFSATNKDWTDIEKESVRKFITALLQTHLSASADIGMMIECVLTLGMLPQHILNSWTCDKALYKVQVAYLYKHFNFSESHPSNSQGIYFRDSEKITGLFNLLIQKFE